MHITYMCIFNAFYINTSFLGIDNISERESLRKLSTSQLHFYMQ